MTVADALLCTRVARRPRARPRLAKERTLTRCKQGNVHPFGEMAGVRLASLDPASGLACGSRDPS